MKDEISHDKVLSMYDVTDDNRNSAKWHINNIIYIDWLSIGFTIRPFSIKYIVFLMIELMWFTFMMLEIGVWTLSNIERCNNQYSQYGRCFYYVAFTQFWSMHFLLANVGMKTRNHQRVQIVRLVEMWQMEMTSSQKLELGACRDTPRKGNFKHNLPPNVFISFYKLICHN